MSTRGSLTPAPRLLEWICVVALVLVGIFRVASTWSVFSNTYDEGWHVGAGMQWLDQGKYTYEQKHPPLARVAVALGPWLGGLHSTGNVNLWEEGPAILYQNDSYVRNLSLARAGVIPFFALGVLFVWLLTRRVFGPMAGVAAAALFSTLPPILGHAGVATTDIALTGTFAALLFTAMVWLERPTVQRGVWLGVTSALALLTKFSAIPYFGVAAILALLARWRGARRADESAEAVTGSQLRWSLRATLLVAFITTWAAYRFSITTLYGIPVPLLEIRQGFAELAAHNDVGHHAFVLGRAMFDGVWYFFPVVLLFKTPLPVLVLAAMGLWYAWRRAAAVQDWRSHLPLIVIVAVLVVAMPSRINIGVRHILPVYLGISAAAGFAIATLWSGIGTSRLLPRIVTATLLAAYAVGTSRAHPDYLAYFNVLAGAEPGRILVDSDLDWGQDLTRLGEEVRRRGIDSITVEYFGNANIEKHVPHAAKARDHAKPSGWFAISETSYQRGTGRAVGTTWTLKPDYWAWLRDYEPVARVGKSIRLYYLP